MRSTSAPASLLALILVFSACAEQPAEDDELVEETLPAPAAETEMTDADEVTVADVAGDPAQYAGRTVTVGGDVEEVLGPMAFTIDEDAVTEGGIDNDLLVISNQANNLAAIDDQWIDNRVRVTGSVGTWTLVEIEREAGWDLDPSIEAEIEGREAVLIATSVEQVPD